MLRWLISYVISSVMTFLVSDYDKCWRLWHTPQLVLEKSVRLYHTCFQDEKCCRIYLFVDDPVCECKHWWNASCCCTSDFSSNEACQVLVCWARPGDHRQTEGSKGQHPLFTSRRAPASLIALWLAVVWSLSPSTSLFKVLLKSVCSTTLLPRVSCLHIIHPPCFHHISPYPNFFFTTSPTNL